MQWLFIAFYKQTSSRGGLELEVDKSKKSYIGEGSASFKKLEKPVWRPKGRQLNKFRSLLLTIMKRNCCILPNCLPSDPQSCVQAICSLHLYNISLDKWSDNRNLSVSVDQSSLELGAFLKNKQP